VHAHPAVHTRTVSEFAIRIDRVSKTFGHIVAVDDLCLTVDPGEVFGFLGPNGAGKSTTIRVLLGLIRPASCAAQVFGDDGATSVGPTATAGFAGLDSANGFAAALFSLLSIPAGLYAATRLIAVGVAGYSRRDLTTRIEAEHA
jgi:ABC-type transporter Mla maintaining outer membrane lipid asymmetry ATPase subunit MlaF